MAESIDVSAIAATMKHYAGNGDVMLHTYTLSGMQPDVAPAPDPDEYSVPGAYGEGQAVTGAAMGNNPAHPGSATAPGQPEGSLGGAGSTGIVGDIPHGS